MKDLLLTLLELSTLIEAIAQVVRCDNMLFEHRQERHHEPPSRTQKSFAPPTTQRSFPPTMPT